VWLGPRVHFLGGVSTLRPTRARPRRRHGPPHSPRPRPAVGPLPVRGGRRAGRQLPPARPARRGARACVSIRWGRARARRPGARLSPRRRPPDAAAHLGQRGWGRRPAEAPPARRRARRKPRDAPTALLIHPSPRRDTPAPSPCAPPRSLWPPWRSRPRSPRRPLPGSWKPTRCASWSRPTSQARRTRPSATCAREGGRVWWDKGR